MKKIYQYILLVVAMVATASCSNELDDTLQPVNNGTLQFVVGDFPAFGEGTQTRAIGTQDEGKTAWENGDQIIVTLISQKYGEQAAALTYDGSSWSTEASLSYLENETPVVSAIYAPCYEVNKWDELELKDGMKLGMTEYLEAACKIEYGTINISFSDALRTYSRLRIAGLPNQTLTVTTTDFTPVGATSVATEPYTLAADEKGNAYLYGVFAEGAMVNVNNGELTYTFGYATVEGKSYALDARPKDGRSIVFVEGVNRETGWYDVNKVGKGENGDINMCWAASASNIIQWWQDRYVAAGETLPAQAVTGAGSTYELALMEMFHQQWNNDRGGQVAEAVPWYFEGVNYGVTASPGSQAYPLSGCTGGYFKEVWDDIYPCLYHEYTYMLGMYTNLYVGEFNNYYLWGDGSGLMGKERLRYFTQLVVDFVARGIASLTVSLSSNLQTLHHATTIWGYEIDNTTGLLTRLWITDSDDLEKEPKAALLNEYEVSIGEGYSHIKLSSNDVRYGACYAVALTPVSGFRK